MASQRDGWRLNSGFDAQREAPCRQTMSRAIRVTYAPGGLYVLDVDGTRAGGAWHARCRTARCALSSVAGACPPP